MVCRGSDWLRITPARAERRLALVGPSAWTKSATNSFHHHPWLMASSSRAGEVSLWHREHSASVCYCYQHHPCASISASAVI